MTNLNNFYEQEAKRWYFLTVDTHSRGSCGGTENMVKSAIFMNVGPSEQAFFFKNKNCVNFNNLAKIKDFCKIQEIDSESNPNKANLHVLQNFPKKTFFFSDRLAT